mgnify:CR=1 FL=1
MNNWVRKKFEVLREKNKLLEQELKNNYFLLFNGLDGIKQRKKSFDIPGSILHDIQTVGSIKHKYKYIPAMLIEVENYDNLDVLKGELEKLVIEKEHICSIPEDIPVETNMPKLKKRKMWNLELVEAYEAQELNKGQGIIVAVIDTGCDYTHPEIESRFDRHELGWNFVHNNNDPFDDNMHGTHTAGTISGT